MDTPVLSLTLLRTGPTGDGAREQLLPETPAPNITTYQLPQDNV